MLSSKDLLKREYGIAISNHCLNLACLQLTQTTTKSSRFIYHSLVQTHTRLLANALIVNWLSESNIKYEVKSITPASQPLNTSIFLGGWRLVPYINLFTPYRETTKPDINDILTSDAYINLKQWHCDTHTQADLLVLGYSIPKIKKQPNSTSGVYHMPTLWQSPKTWKPLSDIKIQSHATENVELTLYGVDSLHQPISSTCKIPPGGKQIISSVFCTLNFILSRPCPKSLVSISVASQNLSTSIQPANWQPWSQTTGTIIFTGYTPYNMFNKSVKRASRRDIHPILGRLSQAGWYILTRNIKPLSTLIETASTWQSTDKK